MIQDYHTDIISSLKVAFYDMLLLGLPVLILAKKGKKDSVGRLLEFSVLATSWVISGRGPTCDSVHSSRLYGAIPLGDQATCTVT